MLFIFSLIIQTYCSDVLYQTEMAETKSKGNIILLKCC